MLSKVWCNHSTRPVASGRWAFVVPADDSASCVGPLAVRSTWASVWAAPALVVVRLLPAMGSSSFHVSSSSRDRTGTTRDVGGRPPCPLLGYGGYRKMTLIQRD